LLDDFALDKYLFERDAYLQHRRSLICDCDPPALDEVAGDAGAGNKGPYKPAK